MSDIEGRLTKECDEWFAKVEKLLGAVPEPEEDWTALWFDGYTPEDAIRAINGT